MEWSGVWGGSRGVGWGGLYGLKGGGIKGWRSGWVCLHKGFVGGFFVLGFLLLRGGAG